MPYPDHWRDKEAFLELDRFIELGFDEPRFCFLEEKPLIVKPSVRQYAKAPLDARCADLKARME